MNNTAKIINKQKNNSAQAAGFLFTDVIELLVARHYEKTRGASFMSIGYIPEFDLRFKDGSKFEVKYDKMASSTGNFAVEYFDKKTGYSGILNTEANFYLQCIPQGNNGIRCFEVSTRALLKLCIESEAPCISGGNDSTSKMKIIPVSNIIAIANDEFVIKSELIEFFNYQ